MGHDRPPAAASATLVVDGLRRTFEGRGGPPVLAVDGIGFTLQPGEIVGLLGMNGAGKTTTLKCIAGLIEATAGRIRICDVDVARRRREALRQVAAALEGTGNVIGRLSARENLEFFAGLHGIDTRAARRDVDDALDRFNLRDRAAGAAQTLSRGMQQRLALACCLVRRAPLILLDEPTLGLDLASVQALEALIRATTADGRRSVLLSSHDMQLVERVCDRVVIINNGRLVADERITVLSRHFRARNYRIEMSGAMDLDAEAVLRTQIYGLTFVRDQRSTWVDTPSDDQAELHAVLAAIRDAGVPIRSVAVHEPDLAEVFLRIVADDGAP